MTKVSLVFLLFYSSQILSQSSDSLQSIDSIQVTDTLKITDSLQTKTDKPLSDSLKVNEIARDSLQTPGLVKDSMQMDNKIQPIEVFKKQSVKDLHFLIGRWKGEGWRLVPGGQKNYIMQTEVVDSKQNGDVLIIEGVGIDRESLRIKPKVVHNAFAIVYFNSEIQKVQIMAFNRGRRIVTEPDILDDGSFQWGFIIPDVGQVRYHIQLTDQGEWHEIGEFSRDGQQWMQNFEMTLIKVN
jgi:hypothetical protein